MLGQKVFKDIPELRVFIIDTLSPTNTKGSRVKIIDQYYPDSKIIPYGYKGNAASTAYDYLNSLGIKCIGRSSNVLISKNLDIRLT